MYTCTYNIAGFPMVLTLPSEAARRLMPSMEPFRTAEGQGDPVAEVRVIFARSPRFAQQSQAVLLEQSHNDMGHVQLFLHGADYVATVSCAQSMAIVRAGADFAQASITLDPDAPNASSLTTSALRIIYSQAITFHKAMAIHASCVVAEGKAQLFCGTSGAGKSTHSRMWLQTVPGARLLNDDCPIVRLLPEGSPVAYGSPWSGKTPMYQNSSAPLAALVLIHKGEENKFTALEGVDAYISFLPGCSSLRSHGQFFSNVCDTLLAVIGQARTGILTCLPEPRAASICHSAIYQTNS